MAIYQRMSTYYPEDTPYRPQKRVYPSNGFGDTEWLRKQAEWMATINLSKVDTWEYPLKTSPRPKGRATHVIITEYDLPRKNSVPHDLVLASNGEIWYDDSGWQYLGKLDPKTGNVTEYPVPTFNPDFPVGMLDLQKDKDGNLWPAMMDQGKLMKFDVKTLQFKFWELPKEENLNVQQINFLMPYYSDVDGKVWTDDMNIGEVRRLDVNTGHVDLLKVLDELPGGAKGHGLYDFAADSKNNGYLLDITGGTIIKVDAKTTKVTMFPTPTPASGPRRGTMDSQDRLWFGEYRGNRIGMFDTKTEKFQEWLAPIPWTAPYGAMLDNKGDVWSMGITTDRVQRWDPKSGQVIDYLMPRNSSLRRIDLDNSSAHTILWAPNKNSASIIKVEPLD
jgi:virginiamycin B lyase